jgi:hypothetical protein
MSPGSCLAQPTILTDIAALLVDVLKLAQRLDDVNVLARPCYDQLRALVQAVVEHLERFQNMAPILALVVQPFVEHVHDLIKVCRAGAAVSAASETVYRTLLVEGDLGDLGHVGAHGTPGVVAGSCSCKDAQLTCDVVVHIPLRTLTSTPEYPFVTF